MTGFTVSERVGVTLVTVRATGEDTEPSTTAPKTSASMDSLAADVKPGSENVPSPLIGRRLVAPPPMMRTQRLFEEL